MNRMSSTLWILTGALAALSINSARCLGNVTGTEGLEEASDAQEGEGNGDDPGQQANEAEDLPAGIHDAGAAEAGAVDAVAVEAGAAEAGAVDAEADADEADAD